MSYIPTTYLSGTTVLNFGVEGDNAVNTISNTKIKAANIAGASFVPQETTETSIDDFKLNAVTLNVENIVDNTSFDVSAKSFNGATGNYTVKYLITILA